MYQNRGAPNYQVDHLKNKHGARITRFRFKTFEELELFFMDELIGSDMMEGSASKVIGTTLLIWDRN